MLDKMEKKENIYIMRYKCRYCLPRIIQDRFVNNIVTYEKEIDIVSKCENSLTVRCIFLDSCLVVQSIDAFMVQISGQ